MESTRQRKFARLIQKELGDIFQKDLKEITGNHLVTITVVRVSPDLGIAKVYLSFLPDKGKTEKIDMLRENIKQIRQELAARIRHQVRIIPELQFFIDDTEEEAMRINQLLAGLNIPPAPAEEAEDSEE
ncbi:30S ribosome-binding factor RbfA [Rhodoflexus caldus]|jgi:ribosome-binding factor A|uniref:30S ribosome-binding factor RbfA n=1 Tax=Rhodoflexus caldus TaxID=2891236 RepID=UPI00202A0536|nr:30S ribosome-binding factor RbfA [Rhodoflexus caldus]